MAEGRLLEFHAVPSQAEAAPAGPESADWRVLFEEAGLSLADFHKAEPQQLPPVCAGFALYGFYTSAAGQPFFRGERFIE